MTPDLPTRVREAFDAEFDARRSLAARPRMDAALAAVIAVVQEDRSREIHEAVVTAAAKYAGTGSPGDVLIAVAMNQALDVIAKIGGTTHD